jgi:hypothetical protein
LIRNSEPSMFLRCCEGQENITHKPQTWKERLSTRGCLRQRVCLAVRTVQDCICCSCRPDSTPGCIALVVLLCTTTQAECCKAESGSRQIKLECMHELDNWRQRLLHTGSVTHPLLFIDRHAVQAHVRSRGDDLQAQVQCCSP